MKSVRDVHVSLVLDQERFGVIVWISPNSTIRNTNGNMVPGVLLSSDEARLLARKIREEAKRMEVWGEMG